MDEIEDFEKFHDQIIFENTQLKAKLGALEELVKSSLFLLFDNNNFNQLIEESLMKEANDFDNLSRNTSIYNKRNTNDARRMYLFELQQKLEKVKNLTKEKRTKIN